MWVRGLKPFIVTLPDVMMYVAPYVGAWIETRVRNKKYMQLPVAPYVGAWIETSEILDLKSARGSRTLCGCVD